ncbi:CbtB domain-containing protein [Raineyella sp. W15-4]|uniref:CbtB domain-containing protein n=1 Tax=Raineyella sp. W15-4 TaxID=3081651 RepID=UPI002954AAF4|nr:CbtB domain-containing protein [Raineyella sp. W15-4]WOQ16817.1 CbtB domain-containing protein [Raineyella sp. W15-4]
MSAIDTVSTQAVGTWESLSAAARIVVLSVTVLLALAIYYFVGFDEGMTSVFGDTMVVHEWVHDARHFLGFACH